MEDYSKYISEKRRAIPAPKDLVDENGKVVFGTFANEFETMELLRAKRPTKAPDFLNKFKLTLWEATEVHLKDGVLLAVVCDMGIFGKQLNMFYDKRDKKVYCWDTQIKSKDTIIAPNLINGSIAKAESEFGFVKYVNDFQDGKAELSGKHTGKCQITVPGDKICSDLNNIKASIGEATIEYDFKLTRKSLPCIVSIPFPYSDNRTLYSQKDLFKAEGKLIFNGEEMLTDEDSAAIIDDHRGYYPRKAHYDWVSTMGTIEIDGKKQQFGFNLTHNQSTNETDYNENIIFLEGKTSILPPVKFTRSIESKDFTNYSEWTVKDEFGMVDLKFKVYGMNPMIMHAGVVNIDYYVVWGELEGYLMGEDGKKYVLDGMMGIGEDKTLLL